MRVTFVDASNRHQHQDIIFQSRRLRHKIFVEELRWSLKKRASGLEFDDFDTDATVEMMVQEDDGTVVGYQRFLPTTGPHLLSHIYPYLCSGTLPSAHNLYEWTRLAVAPTHRGYQDNFGLVTILLFTAAVQWGLENNMQAFIGQLDPTFIAKLKSHSFRVVPLGTAHVMDGVAVMAVRAEFDASTLTYLHELQRQEQHRRRPIDKLLTRVETSTSHSASLSDNLQNWGGRTLDLQKARL